MKSNDEFEFNGPGGKVATIRIQKINWTKVSFTRFAPYIIYVSN